MRNKRCCLCGSTEKVQAHHLGGRKHMPYFAPLFLCEKHHNAVHTALRMAGVNLKAVSELDERKRQARLACLVLFWYLEELES